jgi:hypothetical protein
MAVKNKTAKKIEKKKVEVEEDEGMSLDDAFADDDDVEYAKPKPAKVKPVEKKEVAATGEEVESIQLKASKPIGKLKRGDVIKVDGLPLEVDAHTVLIDHGTTKEMAIECFDPKKDKDYEVRYFDDQVERTIEVYELQEIMYIKKPAKKIEW